MPPPHDKQGAHVDQVEGFFLGVNFVRPPRVVPPEVGTGRDLSLRVFDAPKGRAGTKDGAASLWRLQCERLGSLALLFKNFLA